MGQIFNDWKILDNPLHHHVLILVISKYIKHVYNFMVQDIKAHPNKVNWAVLVRNLLSEIRFYEDWVQQGVGNYNVFISLLVSKVPCVCTRDICNYLPYRHTKIPNGF